MLFFSQKSQNKLQFSFIFLYETKLKLISCFLVTFIDCSDNRRGCIIPRDDINLKGKQISHTILAGNNYYLREFTSKGT